MKPLTVRSRTVLLSGIAIIALVLPALAFGQATRTWVSGVGDDANPCSRTAPCKTFAGAISKTATCGEINVIDPGGFGAVTITKCITISGEETEAGVLVAGGNGILVNAPATANVVLRDLDIEGLVGSGGGVGVEGIRVIQAKAVKVDDTDIHGFLHNGIDFEASNSGAKLVVVDSQIFDNGGNGVLVAPPAGGNATATVRNTVIASNSCGLTASNHLVDGAFNYTSNCGTLAGAGGPAKISAFDNTIADETVVGVFSNGQSSSVKIGGNSITGNPTGMSASDPGAFGGIFTFQDNYFTSNISDGTPNGTITKK